MHYLPFFLLGCSPIVWVATGFGYLVVAQCYPLNGGFYGPRFITMIAPRGPDDHHILVVFIYMMRKRQEKVMGSIPIGRSHLTMILTPRPVSSVPFPSDRLVRRETCPTELEATSGAYTKSAFSTILDPREFLSP
jgi:hypothetical protein